MSVYFGTFENKVDRKGRVSVPAPFRQILATSAFQGLIAFRYHAPNAMEACSVETAGNRTRAPSRAVASVCGVSDSYLFGQYLIVTERT